MGAALETVQPFFLCLAHAALVTVTGARVISPAVGVPGMHGSCADGLLCVIVMCTRCHDGAHRMQVAYTYTAGMHEYAK
jgi:hypothetical protein